MSYGEPLFEGTWREALSHPDSIPETTRIRIVEIQDLPDDDELCGKTLADLFLGRVGVLSFEPTDLARRSEEYLDGFGELTDSQTTQS